jgi:hypothetical protein
MAVGLFNRGRYEIANPSRNANPKVWKLVDRADKSGSKEFTSADEANAALKATEAEAEATVNWSDLKLSGSQAVRDLWRQKDLGKHDSYYKTTLPFHGAVMLKIGTPSAAD